MREGLEVPDIRREAAEAEAAGHCDGPMNEVNKRARLERNERKRFYPTAPGS
jgi:hypothetical protein